MPLLCTLLVTYRRYWSAQIVRLKFLLSPSIYCIQSRTLVDRSKIILGGNIMKSLLVVLAFLSTPVFATATSFIYEGDCIVNTVVSSGAALKILAQKHVTLTDQESVVLLKR